MVPCPTSDISNLGCSVPKMARRVQLGCTMRPMKGRWGTRGWDPRHDTATFFSTDGPASVLILLGPTLRSRSFPSRAFTANTWALLFALSTRVRAREFCEVRLQVPERVCILSAWERFLCRSEEHTSELQ